MELTNVECAALEAGTHPEVHRVSSSIFAIVQPDGAWGLSNVSLVCGGDDAVLVDTFFTERRNDVLRGLVTSLCSKPPRYLVNTHHHGDHVYGNGWFPEAVIVAHRATREAIERLDPAISARRFPTVEFGETRASVPTLTFDDNITIHTGNCALDVIFPGVAHCVGNSVVFVREEGVLVAGDLLLKNCTPSFVGGSAVGFYEVLTSLRGLEPEIVVPGHGPVCDGSVIDETERYLDFVFEHARGALKRGRSPLEAAAAAELSEFETWRDPERLVGNLYRAMSEISGETVDFAAMWRDSLEYRGAPLHSRA